LLIFNFVSLVQFGRPAITGLRDAECQAHRRLQGPALPPITPYHADMTPFAAAGRGAIVAGCRYATAGECLCVCRWNQAGVAPNRVATVILETMRNLGKVFGKRAKHLTFPRNRFRTTASVPSSSLACQFQQIMSAISSNKPYRIGRSRTGLGLFATKPIKKGAKIVRYFGPLLDSRKKKDDAVENKYLFELTNRWTIDGSVRANIARYINHACRPNAESDVKPRKRKVVIRAIKNIEPGEEINYDYGTDYFKAYLKPIGCKCDACEKKRKKKRAEARAERARLKAKAERKAARQAEKRAAKAARKLNGHAKVNGASRNGHGGKSAADKMLVAKSGISVKALSRQDRERRTPA
jgi:uncharacterized protein